MPFARLVFQIDDALLVQICLRCVDEPPNAVAGSGPPQPNCAAPWNEPVQWPFSWSTLMWAKARMVFREWGVR